MKADKVEYMLQCKVVHLGTVAVNLDRILRYSALK